MNNNKLKNKNPGLKPYPRSGSVSPSANRGGLASLKRERRGQLLIEMLVALGILTFGFLGVTTLLSRALSLNRVVSDNYTATYLASEGIEIAKNILDSNAIKKVGWNEGFSDGNFEADFQSLSLIPIATEVRNIYFTNNQYGYDQAGIRTPFQRTISVSMPNVNEVVVHSLVEWTSRGAANFRVDLEDHFYHWR